MKKILLILIIFTGLLILLQNHHVYAQETCGDAQADSPGNRCCKLDIDSIDFNQVKITSEQDVANPNKWGCVKFLIAEFCISDLLTSGVKNVKNVLTRDNALDELAKEGACISGKPSKLDVNDPDCICVESMPGGLKAQLCNTYIIGNMERADAKELLKSKEYTGCVDCFAGNGFWTALGCFYLTDWKTFMEKNVLGLSIGLAGIISLLCIIFAAFSMQTSAGNPEKIKKAQQLLTSCITGLMLIIFSVFILRLIGVNILGIPGFK